MTVADNTSRNQYSATSGQTVFAYTFEIVDKGDIVVLKNGTTLSEGTNYTVSNVGNDSGGNVTLTVGATAGDILTLYRDMPYARTQNYTNSGDFLASEVNSDFDNLWLAGEQTNRSFSQSIRKPITDSDSISMELPAAADRANKYLQFDNNGAVAVQQITPATDASAVTYMPAGTGAVQTTVQAKLREIVSVKDFGAVGDGVTDDTAAIQAAISAATNGVYFPPGTYVAAEIPLNKSNFVYDGSQAMILNNLAGELHTFVLRNGENIRRSTIIFKEVQNSSTAGHIFSFENGAMSGCLIDIKEISHRANAYKILTNEVGGTLVSGNIENDNVGLFFNKIRGNQWACNTSNTADELIYWCSSVNTCSVNTFEISDIRPFGTGRFAKFHSTSSSGASLNQIKFQNMGVEKSNNGFVTFLGCNNSGLENVTFYDMDVANPTIDADLIIIKDGDNGASSSQSYCRDVIRTGGILNSNIHDIVIDSDQVRLNNIGGKISGAGFTVDCGNERVVATMAQHVTFENTRFLTNISDGGTQLRGFSLMNDGTSFIKTIASGVVTVDGAGYYRIATEGSASSDDLDTINGTSAGDIIIITPSTADNVIVKHNTGNIFLYGEADVFLNDTNKGIMLFHEPASNKLINLGGA
jgi:hypothetical protein